SRHRLVGIESEPGHLSSAGRRRRPRQLCLLLFEASNRTLLLPSMEERELVEVDLLVAGAAAAVPTAQRQLRDAQHHATTTNPRQAETQMHPRCSRRCPFAKRATTPSHIHPTPGAQNGAFRRRSAAVRAEGKMTLRVWEPSGLRRPPGGFRG